MSYSQIKRSLSLRGLNQINKQFNSDNKNHQLNEAHIRNSKEIPNGKKKKKGQNNSHVEQSAYKFYSN